MSHSDMERLDEDEGNMLTAIPETHASGTEY
jgi:hypothetical protein